MHTFKTLALLLASVVMGYGAPIITNFNTWNGAEGLSLYTSAGITITASPSGSTFHITPDGIGINGPGNDQSDEIDRFNILGMSFSTRTINSITFTNAFDNILYRESFWYSPNGGPQVNLNAASGQYQWNSNGVLTVVLNITGVNALTFGVNNPNTDLHSFTLSSMTSTEDLQGVPETGTFLLMGAGLCGIAALRGRR